MTCGIIMNAMAENDIQENNTDLGVGQCLSKRLIAHGRIDHRVRTPLGITVVAKIEQDVPALLV